MNTFFKHLTASVAAAVLVFSTLCASCQTQIELSFSSVRDGQLVSYASGSCLASESHNSHYGTCDVVYHDTGVILPFVFRVTDDNITVIGPDGTVFTYLYSHTFGSARTYTARFNTDFCIVQIL